jgi:exopolysaccharide production protein ExoQ
VPPSLVLLACTVFVFFLLRVERQASRDVSMAVWIPTLWVMIAATGRPLETWFTGGQPIFEAVNNESGNSINRWTLSSLAAVAIVIIVARRFNWSGAMRRQGWLIVLLLYMLLSTLWSDITIIAMKRLVREFVAVVMAFLIMSEVNPLQALASLLRRCGYVLLPFSVVLIKYYPALGRQYARWSGVQMWIGVTSQKNQLGRLCMISVFFLLFALYQRWQGRSLETGRRQAWSDVSIIVIGVYLLIGSSSATSLATLIVGVVIFIGLQWFQKFRSSLGQIGLQAAVVFLIAYGTAVPFLGGSNVAAFTSMLGRDETLTGRTEVWAEVLPARAQQPLLGYGFGSFWTDARRERYDIPTAHNGYLDILLELGEVGLAFYTAWLLSCARQLHRAMVLDYDWASFGICLLFLSLIYNSTESALNSLTEYITAIMVLVSLVVPARLGLKSASALPVPLTLSSPPAAIGRR